MEEASLMSDKQAVIINSAENTGSIEHKKLIADMKVNELKAELERRNLPINGVKALLVERLEEAMTRDGLDPGSHFIPIPLTMVSAQACGSVAPTPVVGQRQNQQQVSIKVEESSPWAKESASAPPLCFSIAASSHQAMPSIKVEAGEEATALNTGGEVCTEHTMSPGNHTSSTIPPNVSTLPAVAPNLDGLTNAEASGEKAPAGSREGSGGQLMNMEQASSTQQQQQVPHTPLLLPSHSSKMPNTAGEQHLQNHSTPIAKDPFHSTNEIVDIGDSPNKERPHCHSKQVNEEAAMQPDDNSSTLSPCEVEVVASSEAQSGPGAPKPKETNTRDAKELAEKGLSLWVKNITSTTKAAELKALFSKHARVASAKIYTTKNKSNPTCFGFITTTDEAGMASCLAELHGYTLNGNRIEVTKAGLDNLPNLRGKKTPGTKASRSSTATTTKPTSSATEEESPSKAARTNSDPDIIIEKVKSVPAVAKRPRITAGSNTSPRKVVLTSRTTRTKGATVGGRIKRMIPTSSTQPPRRKTSSNSTLKASSRGERHRSSSPGVVRQVTSTGSSIRISTTTTHASHHGAAKHNFVTSHSRAMATGLSRASNYTTRTSMDRGNGESGSRSKRTHALSTSSHFGGSASSATYRNDQSRRERGQNPNTPHHHHSAAYTTRAPPPRSRSPHSSRRDSHRRSHSPPPQPSSTASHRMMSTWERDEMLRLLQATEEKHRRREEELRMQREQERIKFEREKLERERLEVQQMRLETRLAQVTSKQQQHRSGTSSSTRARPRGSTPTSDSVQSAGSSARKRGRSRDPPPSSSEKGGGDGLRRKRERGPSDRESSRTASSSQQQRERQTIPADRLNSTSQRGQESSRRREFSKERATSSSLNAALAHASAPYQPALDSFGYSTQHGGVSTPSFTQGGGGGGGSGFQDPYPFPQYMGAMGHVSAEQVTHPLYPLSRLMPAVGHVASNSRHRGEGASTSAGSADRRPVHGGSSSEVGKRGGGEAHKTHSTDRKNEHRGGESRVSGRGSLPGRGQGDSSSSSRRGDSSTHHGRQTSSQGVYATRTDPSYASRMAASGVGGGSSEDMFGSGLNPYGVNPSQGNPTAYRGYGDALTPSYSNQPPQAGAALSAARIAGGEEWPTAGYQSVYAGGGGGAGGLLGGMDQMWNREGATGSVDSWAFYNASAGPSGSGFAAPAREQQQYGSHGKHSSTYSASSSSHQRRY